MFYPKISIITVVYNSETLIERTIQSIINQNYKNIEYIIVDGKSKDNTFSIIDRYKDNISTIISEKDQGIYDAMNKGISLATGDYLLFLNSGDEFHSVDTLEYVFTKLKPNADVYYGKTEIFNEHQKSLGERRLKPPKKLNWKSLKFGMVVCHQSFIVRRSLVGKYDLKYKIAADIDWMISSLKASKEIVNSEIFISKFVAGGVSRNNIIKSLKERFNIMLKNYGFFTVLFCHIVISIKFFSYLILNRKIN